jgi:hypothetical protein
MTLNFVGYAIEVPLFSFAIVGLSAAPVLISVIAIVRIVQRAGYNGCWALIIFVPIVNMLALWYFGFGPWPADIRSERER